MKVRQVYVYALQNWWEQLHSPPLTLLSIPRFNENLIELPMKIKRNNDDTVGAGRERRLDVRVRLICFAIPAVDFVGVKGEYMR